MLPSSPLGAAAMPLRPRLRSRHRPQGPCLLSPPQVPAELSPRPLPQTCCSRWRVASLALRPGAVLPVGALSSTAHSDLPPSFLLQDASGTRRSPARAPPSAGPCSLLSPRASLRASCASVFPCTSRSRPPPAPVLQNAPLGATPCLWATALLTPSPPRLSPTSMAPFVSKILIQPVHWPSTAPVPGGRPESTAAPPAPALSTAARPGGLGTHGRQEGPRSLLAPSECGGYPWGLCPTPQECQGPEEAQRLSSQVQVSRQPCGDRAMATLPPVSGLASVRGRPPAHSGGEGRGAFSSSETGLPLLSS